jgi:hypothetical protein
MVNLAAIDYQSSLEEQMAAERLSMPIIKNNELCIALAAYKLEFTVIAS